jgi:hypothetical protein
MPSPDELHRDIWLLLSKPLTIQDLRPNALEHPPPMSGHTRLMQRVWVTGVCTLAPTLKQCVVMKAGNDVSHLSLLGDLERAIDLHA